MNPTPPKLAKVGIMVKHFVHISAQSVIDSVLPARSEVMVQLGDHHHIVLLGGGVLQVRVKVRGVRSA